MLELQTRLENFSLTESDHRRALAAGEIKGSAVSAAIYEPMLWLGERRGMARRRRELLAGAKGRVLEIGAGTGLNLRHYPDDVEEIVLAEPQPNMAALIEAKLDSRPATAPPARLVPAPAERLPFEDDSFDTVVSTMVLCTVGGLDASLDEIKRVLAPGGRLLFCEHVRADSGLLARAQDLLARPWAVYADGCRCDQDTISAIARKLTLGKTRRERWRGMPALVRPLVVGEARA